MYNSKDLYVGIIIGVVLGAVGCYWFATKGDHTHLDTNMSNSTSGLQSTTEVQLVPKSSPYEEDLLVSQKYTAVINGEKVSVPIVKKATTDPSSQPSSSSGDANVQGQMKAVGDNKVIVTQTVDLTPVLKKLKPTWELGIGYMYNSNQHYGVVSVQRNYKDTKAIEVTGFIKDNKFDGGMVQHKWLIK